MTVTERIDNKAEAFRKTALDKQSAELGIWPNKTGVSLPITPTEGYEFQRITMTFYDNECRVNKNKPILKIEGCLIGATRWNINIRPVSPTEADILVELAKHKWPKGSEFEFFTEKICQAARDVYDNAAKELRELAEKAQF